MAEHAESPSATVVISLSDPITRADIPVLCRRLVVGLTDTAYQVVVCDVGGVSRPDATVIDALARLQLTARRNDWELSLRNAPQQLLDLLSLAGLTDVIRVGTPSGVEPGRQTEQGEQTRFHEVGEPGDHPG